MAKKEKVDKVLERNSAIFEIISTIELNPGYLIIEAKLRNATQKIENGVLPPSDFIVRMQGDTKYPVDSEVILKPSARMALLKDIQGLYLLEDSEISAHFPKKD